MRVLRLAAVAGLICAALPVFAQDRTFDPAQYLPPPPAPDSPRAVAEISELKQIQAAATPDQVAAAAYDDRHEDAVIFAAAIGPQFDLAKLPATAAMIQKIKDREEEESGIAKKEFHRDRPWLVDSAIQTCTPHKPGPAANSYPSGHSTIGFAMAVVLASLLPEKQGAILARASVFAENRLVCGYHVRSDIVAGQQFGTILALNLMQTPDFQAKIAAARIELKVAGLAQ